MWIKKIFSSLSRLLGSPYIYAPFFREEKHYLTVGDTGGNEIRKTVTIGCMNERRVLKLVV